VYYNRLRVSTIRLIRVRVQSRRSHVRETRYADRRVIVSMHHHVHHA